MSWPFFQGKGTVHIFNAEMSRVVKFPRQDDVGFVLVSVVSTSGSPLDLKLVGTEGFAPYVFNCKCVLYICITSSPRRFPEPTILPC